MNKEQSAFIDRLYREMYDMLFAYGKSLLDSSSLAEEAIQETFRIACSKPEALMESSKPKGWITNTMKNVVRNMKRTYANLTKLVIQSLPEETYITGMCKTDDYTDIEYSDIIDPEEYKLLKNIVLQKWSMKDAAAELGISVEACKKRVQRAKIKLQKILNENQ